MKKLIIILIVLSSCKKDNNFTFINNDTLKIEFTYNIEQYNEDTVLVNIYNNSQNYDSLKWNNFNGIEYYNYNDNYSYKLQNDSSHILELEGWKKSEYKSYRQIINN